MSRRNRFAALPSPSALLWLLLLAAPPAAATSDGPAEPLTGVDPTVAQLGPECPILCPGRPSFYGALPSRLSAFGDRLLFAASDPAYGVEPWLSDGSFQGTGMLADVCPGDCSSLPLPFGVAAGEGGPLALFWATTPDAGREPWVTDGTAAGTRMLADLCPGVCDSGQEWDWWGFDGLTPAPLRGVEIGGEVYFGAHGPAEGGLYASDGTPAGTRRLGGVAAAPGFNQPLLLTASGGDLYFLARSAASGFDSALWVSDGAAAAPRPLSLPCPPVAWWPPMVAFSGGVVVAGRCGFESTELYRVRDGEVTTLAAVAHSPSGLAAVGGRVYAAFRDLDGGGELWASDGSAAGTGLALDLPELVPGGLHVLLDRLFVDGWPPGAAGPHLYELDDGGAAPALAQVSTFPIEPASPSVIGNRAVWWENPPMGPSVPEVEWRLVSYDPDEMRRREQTIAAPDVAWDFQPRLLLPPKHLAVGEHLFLAANGGSGDQLWVMDVRELVPVCFDYGDSQCLRDGRFRVRVRFHDQHNGVDGTARPDAASRQLSHDTGYFWFFDRDNLELAVKVLDGRGVNGHFWVFAGGPTDVGYDLEVIDMATGRRRDYAHPPGDLCAVVDTTAFAATGAVAGAAGAPRAAAPLTPPPDPECDPFSNLLCVGPGQRFQVQAVYRNQHAGGTEGAGQPSRATDDTAAVRFFPRGGVELMVKVLDGRPVNGHWWVLWGGLTDLGYTLRVHDREGDVTRVYDNPPYSRCGGADTTAF